MADSVGKRKDADSASASGPSGSKRPKVITVGGGNVPDLPRTSYKDLLKRILPKVKIVDDDSSSDRPGKKPAHVYQEPIVEEIMAIMESLDDHPMRLTQHGNTDETSLLSEYSCNAFMAKYVFDPINEILSQWPFNKFYRRWRLLQIPHKTLRSTAEERWCNIEGSNDAPDVRVQLCYTEEGDLNPEPIAAMEMEGKVPSISETRGQSVTEAGQLLLGEAYKEGMLSAEGMHAFEQTYRYLDNTKDSESAVLFTPVASWVLTHVNPARRAVSVSEPFTADSEGPTLKEVVFATVIRELAAAQKRMEGSPNWVQDVLRNKLDEKERATKQAEAQHERDVEKELALKWRKEELSKLEAREAELQTRKAELRKEVDELEGNDEKAAGGGSKGTR